MEAAHRLLALLQWEGKAMNKDEAHKHQLTTDEIEVPLFRHESVEGMDTSSQSGIDTIKVWTCKCGYRVAYDVERRIV